MNEHSYIRSVRAKLPPAVYPWKINDRFTAGVPDNWYSGSARDLWVEYKFVPKPSPSVLPPLSPRQLHWLNARHAQGRNIAVILGCTKGGYIYTDGAWITPLPRDHFLSACIPTRLIADWITQFVESASPPANPCVNIQA